MKDFRDLERAHQLTLRVYRVTKGFPREELYGLTSQVRRCSASIAATIAEGCGRRGKWRISPIPSNCIRLGQ